MTQTANKQKNAPQKQTRPGQRQQERLMRLERRRRRRRIWTSLIVAVVLIGLSGVGFWQYERIISQQPTKTAARATTIPATPTPSAGPATPPPLTGTSITPTALSGGLEYVDIKVGSGTAAQTGSTVSVEYTGWLASNGKKFDSSYDNGGQPFTLTLGQKQVIPGWEEGLVGMKAGGTRRMLIPPALAYGSAGSGSTIPPNATLIFDVTVISVK